MIEVTDDIARKIDRASQILSGLTRVASKDCEWVQRNANLHSEILNLQSELRKFATEVTGEADLGAHLLEAQAAGTRLSELFKAEHVLERAQPHKPTGKGAARKLENTTESITRRMEEGHNDPAVRPTYSEEPRVGPDRVCSRM
jgi:hypothetical protein